MRRIPSLLLSALLLLPTFDLLAQDTVEVSVITGRESGTYYQFGRDLKRLFGRENDIELSVIPSAGSVENVLKVYQFPSIQLGMVQMDALTFLALNAMLGQDYASEELSAVLETMQMVLPLYDEEIHVLARKDITAVSDLAGKRIAIGETGSGSQGTAQVLLESLKIQPSLLYAAEPGVAVEALLAGDVDALIQVVGAPGALFEGTLGETPALHLLPLQLPDSEQSAETATLLSELYTSVTLPAGTYSWQPEAVETLAVRSALITSDIGYCEDVAELASAVLNGLAWLREEGHPKWAEVDMSVEQILAFDSLSPCVRTALQSE